MLVLHLTPTDVRYDSRILKELNSLKKLNCYEVIAFGIEENEGHQYRGEQSENIKVFKLLTKKLTLLPRPIRYFLNLVEAIFVLTIPGIKRRPDIIHCHDTLFLPIAVIIKLICKSKLVYDAHELESNKAGQSKFLSKYTLFIERKGWKYIDLLISVSPSIINWYNNNIGPKKNEILLNSPVFDVETLEQNKFDAQNYLRNMFKIPDNAKIFLYLGIIAKEGRAIDLILDVFKNYCTNSHIVFVGYGEYVEHIKTISAKYSNIHYHAAVKHDQVVKISKSADVGLCLIEPVSLSDYYSLPNKLFEYAFSSLYVLTSDLPDIKLLVEQYGLGLSIKSTQKDLIEAIKKIEAIQSLKVHFEIDKLHELSWNFQEKKLINQYSNLIN